MMDDSVNLFLCGRPVVDETNLRDEFYHRLISDFNSTQSGEGLELGHTPCLNRVLIQIGLMREVNNYPWNSVIPWLKKLFPTNKTADFRRLIETGIATTLSLSGRAREDFLESHVNFNYVGPICDSIGVERHHLLEMRDFSDRAQSVEVTNELILELDNFVNCEEIEPVQLVTWLRNFCPTYCLDGDVEAAYKALQFRIKELKHLHCSYYKRRGGRRIPALEQALQRPFELLETKPDRGWCLKKRIKKEPNHDIKEESEKREISHNTESDTESEQESIAAREQDSKARSKRQRAKVNKARLPTLLDVMITSIQNLSSVYGLKSDTCNQLSLHFLKNKYSLMCQGDPAVSQFEEAVRSHPLAAPVTFIYHNARFLVDVQHILEQEMMTIEKELLEATGEKLGRSKVPKFARIVNFSESAVSRYVHMVGDVLRPGSDRRFHIYWVAFCEEKQNPSRITSVPSNHFTDYLEVAAGIAHHHREIALFFSDLLDLNDDECPNVVLESLSEDASDTFIQSLVCVLAIIYCKVLGPLWQLLNGAGEYALFDRHMLALYQKFLDWSKDPSTLLEPEETSDVFSQFPLQEQCFARVFEYCSLWHTNKDFIKVCLRRMVKAIATVAEEDLKDFLPGGMYSQKMEAAEISQLSRCTFSVLTGPKQVLVTDLPAISSDEADILCDSPLKVKSEGSERTSRRRLDPDDADGFPKRIDKDYIIATVRKNGGPCQTQQDVDRLLLRFEGSPRLEKREVVRCELLYQTTVLEKDNIDPKVMFKSTSEMVAQLKVSLPRVKPSYSFVTELRTQKTRGRGRGKRSSL